MQITPANSLNFNARFLDSKDLKKVANYAVEHGMFDELNKARQNIDSSYIQTRIDFKFAETDAGNPAIIFTRYSPRKSISFPQYKEDYIISRPVIYTANEPVNPLKFALEKIIKMGQSVPNNNIFKRVVIESSKQ